ncbi:universal stress protein [Halovenus marina]|uniref:universal stress protein n=1 Tax=Halovenus marina TaxID=3396621 RepID=UPI003F570DF0
MTIVTAVNEKEGSSRAVTVGYELAEQFDDDLVVVHVMPQSVFEKRQSARAGSGSEGAYAGVDPEMRDTGRGSAEPYTVDQDGKPDAANVARRVVEATLAEYSNVSFEGAVGDPVEQMLSVADDQDARYLVIGGRKRTPVGKAVFGSTTQSVLLNSERPVLTVPDTAAETARSGPVVAAVDRSDRSGEVVREAAALAAATDRDLHVAHVLSKSAFADLDRTTKSGSGDTGEEIQATATSIAEEAAASAADDFTAVGLTGEPSKRIVEYCSEHDASYVVTAGRKRTPVGKVLFGSVTQSVILNADCPVLTAMADS